MKKIVLAALGFGCLLFTNKVNAQNYTLPSKHVKQTVYTYADIHNDITNTSSSAISITWKVLSHDFTQDWKDGTGICDNVTCYIGSVLGNGTMAGPANTTTPFTGTMEFKVQINLETASAATHNLYVELTDGTTTDTVHFEINKWPTNVNKAAKAETGITLYPNPVRSELNVLFDGSAGVKNIAVYNVIGKAVSVYRVTGNSAKLDMDNAPAGIYFLRFIDGNGRVIATRKFTHQ